MSKFRLILFGVILAALFGTVPVVADSSLNQSAIYQMAEIMHRLKHYPSPVGKEVLNKIIQAPNTTENERAIATAMLNLQHRAAASDIPKLQAIIENKNSTAHERALATIVLTLDHRPSKEDKAQLKAMMQ